MKTVVIMPSRARPVLFLRAAQSVVATSKSPVIVYGIIDHDDPQRAEYDATVPWLPAGRLVLLTHPDSGSAPKAIDWAWRQIDFDIIMTLGDDAVIRTKHWDVIAEKILTKDPLMMISTTDQKKRKKLENILCTRQWPEAVGHLINPVFEHFCGDEWVQRICEAAKKIRYEDSIFVEHMHPKYGKGEWDASYRSKREGGGNDRDRQRLAAMMVSEIPQAAARLLAKEAENASA